MESHGNIEEWLYQCRFLDLEFWILLSGFYYFIVVSCEKYENIDGGRMVIISVWVFGFRNSNYFMMSCGKSWKYWRIVLLYQCGFLDLEFWILLSGFYYFIIVSCGKYGNIDGGKIVIKSVWVFGFRNSNYFMISCGKSWKYWRMIISM